jgi:hypothetical protein
MGASAVIGVVLSNDGGSWRTVPFRYPEGREEIGVPFLEYQDGLTSTENDCEPSCADGTQYRVSWSYDPIGDVFERGSARPVTPAPTPQLTVGAPCPIGSDPDCIDPDGDGTGTLLRDGARCMAILAGAPELCTDLDGDGTAGYPDEEGR